MRILWLGFISMCLARLTPLAYGAGVPDLSVQNILSASGLHQSSSNIIIGTAYTAGDEVHPPESVDLGTRSHMMDFTHQSAIEITFRYLGQSRVPLDYSVQWFFIGKDTRGRKRFIFDVGSKPVHPDEVFRVVSKSVMEHQQSDTTTMLAGTETDDQGHIPVSISSSSHREGNKIEGWIVRLVEGNQVINVQASLSELGEFARKPDVSVQLDELAAKAKSNN